MLSVRWALDGSFSTSSTSMFILSELQDIVRIEPHKFSQDMEQKIRDELNKKFANKVSLFKLLIFISIISECCKKGGWLCITITRGTLSEMSMLYVLFPNPMRLYSNATQNLLIP